jgi:hypothetical protein
MTHSSTYSDAFMLFGTSPLSLTRLIGTFPRYRVPDERAAGCDHDCVEEPDQPRPTVCAM